jgi:hypothetical protein
VAVDFRRQRGAGSEDGYYVRDLSARLAAADGDVDFVFGHVAREGEFHILPEF